MNSSGSNARPNPALRLLAAGCALLVLLLGVLSASPTLHAWVHATACEDHHGCHAPTAPAPDAADAQCVVAWFAQGVALAADLVAPAAVPAVWHEPSRTAGTELLLVAPPHRLPLERGPPLRLS